MDVPSALHKPREEQRPARPTELMEAVGQSAPMLRPVPDLPPEPAHARGRERGDEGRGPSRGYKLPEDQRPSRPDSHLWDDTLHRRQTAPPPSASFKEGTPPGAEPPFRDDAPRWSESTFSSEPPADDVPPRREKPSKAEKAPKGEMPPKAEKPAKATAEKPPKPDADKPWYERAGLVVEVPKGESPKPEADKPWYERAGLVVEKVPKGESPKPEKLSKRDAAALAALESLNRDLTVGSGGPPIQRPLNSPATLQMPVATPPPRSMIQWSKDFQAPAAWTEPIATSYVQKRAMLESMKGAKGDQKDAQTPTGTTPNTGTGTTSQANKLGSRFGAAKKPAEVSPPPPVVRSTPVSSSSAPRFSAPYNYPTAGGTKSYPTISSSSTQHTWTPATGASTLNPYFRQYANTKFNEPTAVPYWQRKLENPTASQQIRMINQSWIAARKPEPKDPSPAQRDMLDGNVEEEPPEDPMAAAPTTIWLPKLPKLPEPQEMPDLPPADSLELEREGLQSEASEVVDLTEFQSRREHERDASDSYASADKWVSLKDFDAPPEPDRYENRESNEPSAEDLDWESLVRKPKKSRRRRRKEAEQWEPPPAELEFRDPEPRSRDRERFLEPEPRERREAEPRYREQDEPELRYRRQEEPEPGYSEPEYEVREPRHREPRHREPEYGVR
ncbi:MAG: hypothetical protein WD627_00540, partial [Actinomycetota bacterium]